MKKRVLFVLIPILISSACFANEYALVMSKNDCLCKHMLRLYNNDIKKYGQVKYEQHKEFNWLEWKDKVLNIAPAGDTNGVTVDVHAKIAFFDINNDSKKEVIIYTEGSISNSPTDDYDVFSFGDIESLNETIDGSVYLKKRLEGFSSLGDGIHVKIADLNEEDLKKLPEKLRYSIGERIEANRKSGDKYVYFGDAVKKINFLRFKNRFYMIFEEFTNAEMLGRALDRFYREGGDPKTSRRSNKWLEDGFNNLEQCSVISEYQKDNTLINKCLFIRQDTPAKKATPSFDCQKASSKVEKLICSDDELSRLDDSLNVAYQKALKRTDSKKQLIENQRQWLKKERNACRNTECLKKAYQSRIKELGSLSQEESKSQATESPDKPKLIETEPQTGSTLQRLNKSEENSLEHNRLLQVTKKGTLERIKKILAKGSDVNAKDNEGRTALMAAAKSGNPEVVKFLITKGAYVNAKDKEGHTALSIASTRNRSAIVQNLKSNGAK